MAEGRRQSANVVCMMHAYRHIFNPAIDFRGPEDNLSLFFGENQLQQDDILQGGSVGD